MRGARRLMMTVTVAAALAAAAGCESDSQVVKYRPFFSGLDGATTATPATGFESVQLPDPAPDQDNRILITNPDGSVRLISRSVRDLMTHMERTLAEEQDELFIEQLMSDATKEHLASEGKRPEDLMKVLHASRKDIARTFARMPFGERSPTALLEKTGRRMYVLRLTGQAARDVRFTKLWVSYEGGNFKFVWLS